MFGQESPTIANGGFASIAETEYAKAYMEYENTPSYAFLARVIRKWRYQRWLRALGLEVERWSNS